MELFYLDNSKYKVECPECQEIISFKINQENFSISVNCKNGHNKEEMPYFEFEEKYIKKSQQYNSNCHNCFQLLNDDNTNYKCNICNKLYCSICSNNHIKETKHNLDKFIRYELLCAQHKQKYTSYCTKCKINICDKCIKSHKKHSIKSYLEVIPNKAKIDSVKLNNENFTKKIDEVYSTIRTYKESIDKRYNEIIGFFQFLKNICNNLLINFNNNCFNYYNYENFNYLINSFKNEDIFNLSKYKNYLFKKDEEKIQKENELENTKPSSELRRKRRQREKNEININYIQNLNKLQYLKENIFYALDNMVLKFFKFENFSFEEIMIYDLVKYKLYNISPSKYFNNILLNFEFKKNVKILEYDIKNKAFKLSKQSIKDIKIGYPRHFYKCIDDINGNILTQDNSGTIIWKQDKKKNYIKYKAIIDAKQSLFNINNSLISFQDIDFNIYFYDTINYECNKVIEYKKKINLIGTINDEIIIFNNSFDDILFIVDIKYLEIVQIIHNDKYFPNIKIKDNNLLIFNMEKDHELIIFKRKYDLGQKCFLDTEKIETHSKLSSFSNILITEFDYLVILNYNNMILLSY